jgi:hypothetical protein
MSDPMAYDRGAIVLHLLPGDTTGEISAENAQGIFDGAGPFPVEWDPRTGLPLPTREALRLAVTRKLDNRPLPLVGQL